MKQTFKTQNFELDYMENHIKSNVLRENHCHSDYEMLAVIEGDVNIMLEGRSYRLTENQIIIIPPLRYHTVTANKKGKYKRMTAFFDISAVPDVLKQDFIQRDSAVSIFSFGQTDAFKEFFRDVQDDYYKPLAESLMIQIFYSRLKASTAKIENDETDSFILQIVDYVDKHLCEKIVLDDLARYTARSKSFVCHLFEEKMGIPPMQYILRKRMTYAQKQIHEGQPATLVAEQLGYKSYANFYRLYCKYFGFNPSASK